MHNGSLSLVTNPRGLQQAIGAEKESLLMELQQLNETTNNAVAQLQEENKTLSRDINDLDKQLHDVANEKTILMHGVEKERVKNYSYYCEKCFTISFDSNCSTAAGEKSFVTK